MVHPAYEEEFLNMDHIPWQLVIRLVDNGNRRYEVDQLAREAAALLISRMVYHINATRFVKLRRSVIINQVHVQLFGRITANGINRIAEDDRFLRLGDLTGNSLVDFFENYIQSGEQVSFYDIAWGLTINVGSTMFGNGRKRKLNVPPGVNEPTYNTEEQCGAKALLYGVAYALGRRSEYGDYGDERTWCGKLPPNFKTHLTKLQRNLGWNNKPTVSINEMYTAFNKAFPSLRLCVIHNKFKTCSSFPGPDYTLESEGVGRTNLKTVYVLHQHRSGFTEEHFSFVYNPQAYFRGVTGDSYTKYCEICNVAYCSRSANHINCTTELICAPVKATRKYPTCEVCSGLIYSKTNHVCFHTFCRTCILQIKREEFAVHRCSINAPPAKHHSAKFIGQEEDEDEDEEEEAEPEFNGAKQVWVYDFECAIEWSEEAFEVNDVIIDSSKGPLGKVIIRTRQLATHKPVMIICKNVFTGFSPPPFASVEGFFEFVIGQNVQGFWYAHNARAYDSRLIFDAAAKMGHPPKHPLFNGNKIMRMSYGKQVFLDTILHLQGSLAYLSASFGLPERMQLKKGYFPHLFNTTTNQGYKGVLPPLEMFGYNTLRSDKDQRKMLAWHTKEAAKNLEWDIQKEMAEYCKSDVDILAQLIIDFDTACREMSGGVTPIGVTTSAGYAHKVFKTMYLHDYLLQWDTWQDRSANSWPVLEAEEYYFIRPALRGGRTQVHGKQVTPAQDEKLVSIDVCSQYPGAQVNETFPVGVPTIHVNDLEYYPCYTHFSEPCECPHYVRVKLLNKKLRVNTAEFDYRGKFGFGVFDITPPDRLYHPTLLTKTGDKCLASLEPIVKQHFFSKEVELAVSRGYIVTKCYRFDEYKEMPSLWRQFTIDFFKYKLVNSHPPSPEGCLRYKEIFDLDIIPDQCIFNGAKRMIAKIMCNAPWGKNAENPDKEQLRFFSSLEMHKYCKFQSDHSNKLIHIKSEFMVHNKLIASKYVDVRGAKMRPDLTKGFIAPAICVPSYGRMQLEKVMFRFGKAVHMNDTDSIHITVKNDWDFSDIVPVDPVLGEFEFENDLLPGLLDGTTKTIATVEGYAEKLMFGPKSYMTRYANGKSTLKFKGLCITDNKGTIAPRLREVLSLQALRDMAIKGKVIITPTMQFVWNPANGKGIQTVNSIKKMKSTGGKGFWCGNRLFPFGYKLDEQEIEEGRVWDEIHRT